MRGLSSLKKLEKASLVFTDLADVDLVVTGLHVLSDGFRMAFWVRAAGDGFRHHLLVNQVGHLFEMPWQRQLLVELPGDAASFPNVESELAGGILVLGPAQLDACHRRAFATVFLVVAYRLR